MADLVERLRANAFGDDGNPQDTLKWRAADRIEALEDWQSKRAQDMITLGFLIGRYMKALQRIVEVEDEEGEYYLTRALAEVKAIARDALKDEAPSPQ